MQLRKRMIAAGGAAIIGLASWVVLSTPAAAATDNTAKHASAQVHALAGPGNGIEQSEAAAALPTPPRVKDVRGVKVSNKKASTFPKGKPPTPRKAGITQGTFSKQSGTSKALLVDPVYYRYNSGYNYVEADGGSANLTIHKSYLGPGDYHKVVEVAVQSADGQQKVEVGVVVSMNINGDLDPHLFGYHWVNDVPSCWNSCGWTDNAAVSTNLGDAIPSTLWGLSNIKFGIQFFDNAWWLWYNGNWVGYFDVNNWASQGVTFEKAGLIQVFGESASTRQYTCGDMGTGVLGLAGNTGAANANSYSVINPNPAGPSQLSGPEIAPADANPDKFTTQFLAGSVRSFRYGGPGWNSIGTGPGATGSCAPATAGTCAASTMCIWREVCPDGAAATGCNSAGTFASTLAVNACTAMPSGITNAYKNNTNYRWYFYNSGTSCTGTPHQAAPNSQGKFPAAFANGATVRVKRTSLTS